MDTLLGLLSSGHKVEQDNYQRQKQNDCVDQFAYI